MINKLLEYAKKDNLELEVYAIKNNEITVEYLNDKLANYQVQNIQEYKIKALLDGMAVKITTLDISNPKEIIQQLKTTRELSDELDEDTLAEQIDIEISDRYTKDINPQEIKANIKKFNNAMKQKYKEIFTIRTKFNFEIDEYEIYNTNGVNLVDSNYHSYYYSDVVLKVGDKNLSCDKYIMAKEIDFEKFKLAVEEEIEDTIKKNCAQSISTNKYNIVLNNKSVYDILNAFSVDFYAKNIANKQSVFTDKLNQQIFSEKITIIEDPANANLVGTRRFDTEGTKTYYKKIVDKGVFTTKLYNKKYAAKEKVASTGNVFGVRNMAIMPGEKNKLELFKALDKGIYVHNLMGIHSAINHLTGDISIQCEGFAIENGKKTVALKHIILATNIFELFGQVKEVGSDLEWFSSYGGAPSLLIENITIAGKEV